MPRMSPLGHLRIVAPLEWRERIARALISHASIDDAARALDVSRRTLFRWMREDPVLRQSSPSPRIDPIDSVVTVTFD
jgi:transposase-like protein